MIHLRRCTCGVWALPPAHLPYVCVLCAALQKTNCCCRLATMAWISSAAQVGLTDGTCTLSR